MRLAIHRDADYSQTDTSPFTWLVMCVATKQQTATTNRKNDLQLRGHSVDKVAPRLQPVVRWHLLLSLDLLVFSPH